MPPVPQPHVDRFVATLGAGRTWGEILVRPQDGAFEIRHRADAEASGLRAVAVAELRRVAQFTSDGAFRPLRSAPSLVRGWRCFARGGEELALALHHLYPGSLADAWALETGAALPADFANTADALDGRAGVVRDLKGPALAAVVAAACGPKACLKRRFWTATEVPADTGAGKSAIPCLDPCPVFLSFAQTCATTEQTPSVQADPMHPTDPSHSHRTDGAFRSSPALLGLLAAVAVAGAVAGCGDSSKPAPSAGQIPPPRTMSSKDAAPGGPGSAPFVMPTSNTPATPADEAWSKFEKGFSSPPEPPESWATNPPAEEALKTFQKQRGEAAASLAEAAKDFYTRFPKDDRVSQARFYELQLLDASVKLGHTNGIGRLTELENARLADPATSEDERFAIRMATAQRAAELLLPQGEEVATASLEAAAKKLTIDFPNRPEPYGLLLNLASDAQPDKARATAQSLLSTNVPQQVREAAQDLIRKLDLVGKPLDLKFTALDGREIDLASMRGKVVLLDFWATWCGPCVAELPNVKAAYDTLQPKGFEIVGISFDEDKDALVQFVERRKMAWPQYFDGKGWENQQGRRFGITSIPAMWLVDKKGVLRDMNARSDLRSRVEKLLAEPAEAK